MGTLLDLTFRLPYDLRPVSVEFSTRDYTGTPSNEAFETADFMAQLGNASTLEIRMLDTKVALMGVEDESAEDHIIEGFTAIRELLYDLKVIEAETKARFRFPDQLSVEERIMIRNLRLMLEGHCVAHPRFTRFLGEVNGIDHPGLKQVLTTNPHWTMQTRERAELKILGQHVVVPMLAMAGLVSLEKARVDDIKAAFETGDAAGMQLIFDVLPGDRIRMFLRDRFPADKPIDITPWGLPGIEQKSLGPDGELLS
jgi:hypothetical protein